MLVDPKKFAKFKVSLTERDVHGTTYYSVCTARSQTEVESIVLIWT